MKAMISLHCRDVILHLTKEIIVIRKDKKACFEKANKVKNAQLQWLPTNSSCCYYNMPVKPPPFPVPFVWHYQVVHIQRQLELVLLSSAFPVPFIWHYQVRSHPETARASAAIFCLFCSFQPASPGAFISRDS